MAATKAALEKWFDGAVGRSMNPDNVYGLQCVDVPKDLAITLWGDWTKTINWGNAKDLFNNSSSAHFTKVRNNPQDPNQVPPRGSIIVWGASRAVPEGHIAVVESADRNGLTVIQQDGYLQYPAKRVRLPYVLPNGANPIGWLIPKLAPAKKLATEKEIKRAYLDILERAADADGLAHYKKYTIDFVRADLLKSDDRKRLEARKAAAAKAKADAAKKKAAMEAEAQRIAEEKAAAERLAKQAIEQAQATQEAEQELAKEPPVVEQPVVIPSPDPTAPVQPQPPHPLVRFLFEFWIKLFGKK